MKRETCPHDEAFEIFTRVDRVQHTDDFTWMLECHVRCKQCGVRFEFLGLPAGMTWTRPMVDPSAFELRAPIAPNAHVTSLMATDQETRWPGQRKSGWARIGSWWRERWNAGAAAGRRFRR